MAHFMVDLETLDTRPSTVILSIGAVEFDPETKTVKKESGLLLFPEIDEQLEAGRTVSGSTFLWWLRQEKEARREIYGARREKKNVILERFTKWLMTQEGAEYPWGNGSVFDISIMEHYMDYTRIPWKFYNIRDTRTLWHVHPFDREAKGETAHTALDDAIAQAERVCEVWPIRARETLLD